MTTRTACGASCAEQALERAEALFASLCADLDRERARLDGVVDAEAPRALAAMARETHRALLAVLDFEARVMRERDGADAAPGTIDLEAARDEIEGRLARLAASERAPALPGGALGERAGGAAVAVGTLGASAAPAPA
ncbi:MAG: hypothetical protein ACFBWO_00130 [Paracoccaceae bacterium]